MTPAKAVEIVCTACGQESLVKREPEVDGFRKIGERLSCMACGHVYEDEKDLPVKTSRTAGVFSADDVPKKIDVFSEEEKTRNCRHCRHYVVNPFTQRCALHHKVVEATDVCVDFQPPDPPSPDASSE